MSRIVYTDIIGASPLLSGFYDVDSLEVRSPNTLSATYVDRLSGYTIVVKGSALSLKDGQFVSGTFDRLTFRDDDGRALLRITDGDYRARALGASLAEGGFGGFMRSLFAGDDRIVGSARADDLWGGGGDNTILGGRGRDYIGGGTGDDRLVGGQGGDVFLFEKGTGADVVTDFDAFGGGTRQDHVALVGDNGYTVRRSGDNTVIDFGDGDMLTLLGVDRADISRQDFMQLA